MPNEEMKRVVTKVQPRSGFDKSHQNLFTSKVGTITPILFDEILPNTKVNLRLALSAALPPLASDTFMRCSMKVEAFFVPMRLLFPLTFESWFTGKSVNLTNGKELAGMPPVFQFNNSLHPATSASNRSPWWSTVQPFFELGGLADMLGFRWNPNGASSNFFTRDFSCMPFEVYHLVWDSWYRNARIQQPAFCPPVHEDLGSESDSQNGSIRFAHLPYSRPCLYDEEADSINHYRIFTDKNTTSTHNPFVCADGVSMFSLRQRNFGADYFTTALTSPQMGDPSRVVMQAGENGFSIAALRVANAMQEFRENNGLVSPRTVEVVKQRYGADLNDGLAQRPLLLGTGDFEVYSKGVYQQGAGNSSARNPFNSVASQFGSARASGSEFIIDGFTANEPGYILVNATLVPRVTYSSGVDRQLLKYGEVGCLMDMGNPEFQRVGMQEISVSELTGDMSDENFVFGYADRFSEYMQKFDSMHGLFKSTLGSFALGRGFWSEYIRPELNSSFLEIPTDFLDGVAAVSNYISNYGYWCDCYLDYKVSQPLGKWVVPSLENPAKEHGVTVVMKRGGLSL